MDIKSIILYVVVIVASAGLAILVFDNPGKKERSQDSRIEKVDDPAWYRNASYGTRLAALKTRLALMTSRTIPPEQTGPNKDEIALLCRDDSLVDVVVDAFESHPRITAALLSAYMEIFARVKNPKFARLLKRGFQSPEYDVRMNAADAGILHKDSRAIEEMGEALQVSSGPQATRLLNSLIAVGGSDSMRWLEVALEREEPEILVPAIRTLGDARYANAIPRIRTRLVHPAPSVQIAAAGALAIMGQQDGYRFLKILAANKKADPLERAEAVQMLYLISGKKDRSLYLELAKLRDIIGFEARLNLVKLRDAPVIENVKQEFLKGTPVQRIAATGTLAASGDPDDVDFLAAHIDDMNLPMLRAMISALKRGKAPNATKAIGALASNRRPEAGLALRVFSEFGEAALDDLEIALAKEDDPLRRDVLLRGVANIVSPRSLKILESFEAGDDRDLWLLLRSLIRRVDLGLLKK